MASEARPPRVDERAPSNRVWAVVFVLLGLVSLFGALGAGAPYANDGAQHIAAWELARAAADHPNPYVSLLQPVTSRGFGIVYGALRIVAGVTASWTALHALMVLAMGGAFAAVTVVRTGRLGPSAALGFAFALSAPFAMGFVSFHLGVSAFLVCLALGLADEELSRQRLLLLSAALFVCSVVHVFPAAAAGAIVLAYRTAWASAGSLASSTDSSAAAPVRPSAFAWREAAKAAAVVSLAGVPAALIALLTILGRQVAAPASVPTLSVLDSPGLLVTYLWSAPTLATIVATLGALGSVALGARPRERGAWAALCVVGALLVVGLLAPRDWGNWQFFSLRPLLLATAGAALLLLPGRGVVVARWREVTVASCVAVAVGGAATHTYVTQAELHERCAMPTIGEPDIRDFSVAAEVVVPQPCLSQPGSLVSYRRMLSVLSLADGHRPRWVFNGFEALHDIAVVERFRAPFKQAEYLAMQRDVQASSDRNDQEKAQLAALMMTQLGAPHRRLIVYGDSELAATDALREAGWVEDQAYGRATAWRLAGCDVSLELPQELHFAPAVGVSLRLLGSPLAAGSAYEHMHVARERGAAPLLLSGLPCVPSVIEVLSQRDDGTLVACSASVEESQFGGTVTCARSENPTL